MYFAMLYFGWVFVVLKSMEVRQPKMTKKMESIRLFELFVKDSNCLLAKNYFLWNYMGKIYLSNGEDLNKY